MTYWFFYWLLLLALLGGLASWLSLSLSLGKLSGISVSVLLKTASLSLVLANLGKIIRIAGILGLGVLMGIPLGRKIESHQRDAALRELDNVTIIGKDSPRVYQMYDMKAGHYQAVFCEDQNFEVGERFSVIKYLNAGTCWNLKDKRSSYIYAKEGDKDGWNSNADPYSYSLANSQPDPQARSTAGN